MATKKKTQEAPVEAQHQQIQYVVTLYVNSAKKFDSWLEVSRLAIDKDFKYWGVEILKSEPQYRTYRISLVGPEEKIRYFIKRVGEVTQI